MMHCFSYNMWRYILSFFRLLFLAILLPLYWTAIMLSKYDISSTLGDNDRFQLHFVDILFSKIQRNYAPSVSPKPAELFTLPFHQSAQVISLNITS